MQTPQLQDLKLGHVQQRDILGANMHQSMEEHLDAITEAIVDDIPTPTQQAQMIVIDIQITRALEVY